jgi:hypothetical protein
VKDGRLTVQDYMLSTVDNPFNPFTEFDAWDSYDRMKGYGTLSFLGRIVNTSDDLSEPDQDQAYYDAVDEIIEENVLGLYVKIGRDEVPRARSVSVAS